jgi:hypothetical protein
MEPAVTPAPATVVFRSWQNENWSALAVTSVAVTTVPPSSTPTPVVFEPGASHQN